MKYNHYPLFAPRPWHGMRFGPLWNLLSENHFSITRLPMATTALMVAVMNSMMSRLQRARFERQIADTVLKPPLFIIGHWRTGTTLLHELLSLDEQFVSPSTVQVGSPEHFLLTGAVIKRLCPKPKYRAMDNMAFGWERAQEEEFALLAMGLPTVYRRIAFPSAWEVDFSALTIRDLPKREVESWCAGLRWFLQAVQMLHPERRLLLKSPPHTARVSLLKRLFPEAEFIHITRAPTAFIPSTIRLWEALDRTNALEDRVDTQRITEFVFGCYASMYGDFFSYWPKPLTRGHFELRYDELASNGEAALQALYEGLSLSGWGQMKPKVEAELRVRKDYVPNTHLLEDSLARRIQVECAEYLNYYRY